MQHPESTIYTFERFRLDSAERRLSRDGEAIPLTPKAFDTLLVLVQNAGHALTKDELMCAVWPDGFVEEVNLAYNISILRKALNAADGGPGETYIETIPKLGYRFVAHVQAKSPSQSSSPTHTTIDDTFGDLLSQHLHRKHGLSQSKLAAGILQAPAVISQMCKGRRLSGPQARERVLAIIGWLRKQGALETVAEANALLSAAGMASLRQQEPSELAQMEQLRSYPLENTRQPMRHVARTNLPTQLTHFVGRERELAEVSSTLAAKRLVTLTGAAGMGKTRLAVETGANVLDEFPDGVWLVELAPLADEALAPTAVASTFGLSEQPGRSLVEVLTAFIAEKHMLVILDNCEHVIAASARLADALLRVCSRLHILTTSREALRLPGEVTWRIPPLSTPDPVNLPPFDRMTEYDAVQLFVEHAESAQPGFTPTSSDLATVARICHQLDGMPLAIEMAAAQTAFLGLAGVAAGLDDRFALLFNGSRTAVAHQQTLRATLDWSYNLLTEPERVLLARLSVFTGGWTAETAQVVCESTHQTLLQLARKSLVMTVVNERDGQSRYRLLETIRHYAAEKLRERGERETTLDRHLAYFLDMAEEPMALAEFAGPRVNPWVRRVDADYDNIRAAFARAMMQDDEGEMALRLADAMTTYGFHRGHLTELGTWADRAWSRGEKAPTYARARGLLAKASACLLTGAKAQGVRFCEEALVLLHQTEDRVHLAGCLEMLANNAFNDQVQAYAEEALPLFRVLGSQDGEGRIMRALGTVALRAGDHARAAQLLERAIELAPWDGTVSFMHLYAADPKRALELCAKQYAQLTPSDAPGSVAAMLVAYGIMLVAEGDYTDAKQMLEQSIRTWHQFDAGRPLDLALLTLPLPLDISEISLKELRADVCGSFIFVLLGYIEYVLGRLDYARMRLDQAHAFASEAGMIWLEVIADFLQTSLKFADGHSDLAVQEVVTYLRRFSQLDQGLSAVCALVQIASLEGRRGDLNRACTLLGAAESLIPKLMDIMAYYIFCVPSLWLRRAQTTIIAPTLAAARAQLGDAEFEAAYAEGQRMTFEQAVEYALNECP